MVAALLLVPALHLVVGGAAAADPGKPHEHRGVVAAYQGAPPAVQLTPQELATLGAGQMVIKQVQVGNGGRGVAIMDIKAPASTVWSRITNYASYPKWVDNVAECGNYRTEGTYLYTRFLLDVMGMDVEYYIKHDYRPDRGYLTWTLDYARQSDLDDSVGYWRVTPLQTDPPLTRLEYSVEIRFKGWIPGFVQDMIARRGLENATAWVKKQSES